MTSDERPGSKPVVTTVKQDQTTPVINVITDDADTATGLALTWDEVCKCPPNKAGTKGRNLVVCIDGTANQFSLNNTHVVELYSRLEKDDTQLTYYNSGIGTFVKPSNWIGWLIQLIVHIWDMMVAWNLKGIVLSAYRWLSENYQPGDRIFLFGFSRGAYQVRIIAGMLQVVGLLHKGNNDQIEFAYELYLACVSQRSRGAANLEASALLEDEAIDRKDPRYPWELCKQFKRTLCHKDARVHFVGAWDTVSSVGIARGPSLPETTTGMTHVCGFCHCTSLDELRNKFLPEYGNGGHGPAGKGGYVKEVWFTGSHSDIGGGNDANLKLTSFGPPLRWMLDEAMAAGLRVEPVVGAQWKPAKHTPSMSGVWKVLEYIPFRRLSYDESKDSEHCHQWPPNLFRGRRVQPGQFIHASVIDYMIDNPDYTPAAELNNGFSWDDFRRVAHHPTRTGAARLVVKDLYSSAPYAISVLRDILRPEGVVDDRTLRRGIDSLNRLLSSGDTAEPFNSIPDAGDILLRSIERFSAEESSIPESEERTFVINVLARALAVAPSLPEGCPPCTFSTLQTLLASTPASIRDTVYRRFGTGTLLYTCTGHTAGVQSAVYSPDGKLIASSSRDRTIRLWDAGTGKPTGDPLRGHQGTVWSVAFFPDGKRLVSGSEDKTIRIWDLETHEATLLTGHESDVYTVAVSPDGKLIASGSRDNTIRLWDPDTGCAVGEPLLGHTYVLSGVVFSPDGTRIASSSSDKTARVWDLETREVIRVFEDFSSLYSVCFLTDGMHIVSGASAGEVMVWDIVSGTGRRLPDTGYGGTGRHVAASCDGRYIASGSRSDILQLWDAQTEARFGEPLREHTDRITCVAFSPDSHRIVSASMDESLIVWDIL